MKTAIIYYSKHHENTKKLLDAIKQNNNVTLIDAATTKTAELSDYDLIGFASGIYYSKFQKSVLEFAENNLPENKKVFFIYTCGAKKDGYTKSIKEIANKKHSEILGEFGTLGFDTFGPFKLIGGIAKGHPDNTDCNNAVKFFENIAK